ncbi:MAG TPA: amylo-alpha-1,6-glucosidase [Gemmataceae bacterium]|nr:amylo-alpha-1,6-glucosidase [Gemmataceae bacterium]
MSELATNHSRVPPSDGRAAGPGVEDPYYIAAPAPPAGERDRVLKHGDTFAVFDHHGDIRPVGMQEQGLFHEGTRFLSGLILRLGRGEPLFLSSTVKQDNALLTVDLTNPDIRVGERVDLPRGTLHLFRGIFLWQGACYQRLGVRNYGLVPVEVVFSIRFDADFADIFEVRGTRRARRGRILAPTVSGGTVVLGYEGLDGVVRRSRLEFSPAPRRLTASEAHFTAYLGPQQEALFHVTVSCECGGGDPPGPPTFEAALGRASDDLRDVRARACDIVTSNERFNDWLTRGLADLDMMVSDTPEGMYPYAGVPWFSTPFGRDGIITALQCLWVNPEIARGVLAFLAATQADTLAPDQDAEPGKILHETRRGEMAALREIPFGRYYGSVDSTPLFVLLAGAYYERTGDRPFAESIWPNVERAVRWINEFGDRDKDGFVEYDRHSTDGLVQQGWKDSHDSVFHANGALAQAPIALCEVQAYVYAAKRSGAGLAAALGLSGPTTEWALQAEQLRERFEHAFWCDDLSTYALALDGQKRPCRVRTSNSGHCLFAGIVEADRATRVARTLLNESAFSGWGVRTVTAGEVRYNPMSYHNGSVWPHDNSLIGAGLARYRIKDGVVKILSGLFDASQFFELRRMPELFCGFHRRPGEGPTLYPVACSPQAWAAGSVFLLLQACLGLRIDAAERRVYFDYPVLPPFLREVRIRDLRVGEGSADLLLTRRGDDVGVNVLGRTGRVEVVLVK